MKADDLRFRYLAFVTLLLLLPAIAEAKVYFKTGEMVEISKWDASTHTYMVRTLQNMAIGPLYSTPEDLCAAIAALDLVRIRKLPASILGGQHVIDKQVEILDDRELESRRAEFKKRQPASDQ